MLKKHVIFLEVEGGTDKGPDGHRRDTMPMIRSLESRGWTGEVIFYSDEKKDEIAQYIIDKADAYVSRINPGNLKSEATYFDMLRKVIDAGVVGMAHPDVMLNYGAKDALVKLRDTELVPNDTFAYYEIDEFYKTFPTLIPKKERVLKQNRGSTGEGIWRVKMVDPTQVDENGAAKSDARLRCVEAKDNHVEEHKLSDFMKFCEQYIIGENGMIVDMPFLPRIKEGEIRILMVADKPINVVHKKPVEGEDAFSATLFSGAKYTYDKPEDWQDLVDSFLKTLPQITEKLGGYDLPLIWTADFILDTDENGNDKYILGEMNCSCVGFTSHLEVSEDVAEAIIKMVTENKEKSISA